MKISINSKFLDGPFGGGMQFANFLKKYLEENSIGVVNHLHDKDIDIILHVNPFPHLAKASQYSYLDAYAYKLKHPKTLIVHRVNECDERKDTNHMNKLLLKTSATSDYIVFISSWLKDNLIKAGFDTSKPHEVILNGADETIFYPDNNKTTDTPIPLKLVTHHWSGHRMKGHDVYEKIDTLLEKEEWRQQISFTYIGNMPEDSTFKRTKVLPPMSGTDLANELRRYDVYVTASLNEPAGMHHIEGALCGLPLLYRNSGALPEYGKRFGIMFSDASDIEEKISQMKREFKEWKKKMPDYPNTASHMAEQYLMLLNILHKNQTTTVPRSIVRSWLVSSFSKIQSFVYRIANRLK